MKALLSDDSIAVVRESLCRFIFGNVLINDEAFASGIQGALPLTRTGALSPVGGTGCSQTPIRRFPKQVKDLLHPPSLARLSPIRSLYQ